MFFIRKSMFLSSMRQRLLLITNRKSYTRFRLVPKSTTLVDPEMTLDGNYALHCITHVFRSQPQKFA